MRIRISGTGSALPKKILTNADLEKMVDTSDAWIRERTGIRERHIAEEETTSSLAAEACRRALENAGKKAEDVDLLIVACCTAEMMLPCTSFQVQDAIGAVNATVFDLNAACSGFLFALQTAHTYIATGVYKNALVVGVEVLSRIIDWTDRTTCVLFGDGAGAVFAEATDEEGMGLLGLVQGSIGSRGPVLQCKAGHYRDVATEVFPYKDSYVHMDGGEVYKFAVRQVPDCIEKALEQSGFAPEDIDLYVLHQANIRIIEAIAKRLGVSMDRFPYNLDRVGNTSSAAIPTLLDELNHSGKLKKGMKLVLSGFGAGLGYGAIVMRW
ncbi:MAG: ketoacyl-ACP synthase III [Lachnospiraceae bacterium]|nr:ketoacyl-ACP synthase III [Lachnospiraceae bacterium]